MTRILTTIVFLLVAAVPAQADSYLDACFGWKIEIPAKKPVCLPEGYTSDHGYILLWETESCPPEYDAAGIYVYALHNYETDSNTTRQLGRHICRKWPMTPSPFVVSGFRFYQCESTRKGKRRTFDYFVLRHVPGGYPPAEPTYGVTLNCPRNDCRPLFPMAGWILRHMTFTRRQ